MSLGSCLVTNEVPGTAEAFIQARIEGKSWAQIAEEFNLPNPGAARKAFQKATGISDFKIKGKDLEALVKQGPDALKAVNEAKAAAKKVKALDDVVQKKPPIDAIDLDKHKLKPPEPEKLGLKGKLNIKYGFTDDDFAKMHKLWDDGKATLDIKDAFPELELNEVKQLFKLFDEEYKAAKLAAQQADDALKAAFTGQGPSGPQAFKYNKIPDDVLKKQPPEKLEQLYEGLVEQKNNDLKVLADGKNYAEEALQEAEKKYGKYSGPWEDAYEEYGFAKDEYWEYVDNQLPKLNADIDKISKMIKQKPAAVPNIPVNQPVKGNTLSHTQVAKNTNLTVQQVDTIVELNNSGHGYLAIKDKTGVDFADIDAVVWNDLLRKHNGFTWKAYEAKPTSESGFNAVKAKVYEARSKGLTVQEIAGKPGAPPEGVIHAILNDTWKLPSPGTKIPIIPPPPPPPPQIYGGTLPSSGTNFQRHSDYEMLRWIEPDTTGLNGVQRKAITNYTNSGYHDINSYLRGGKLTNESGYGYSNSNVAKTIQHLDETMRPIPFDTVVTRNFTGIHHMPAAPQDMIGKVYHDNAFMSTTIKEAGVFSGDVQLVINVPAGTPSRYVNDISIHKSEAELLLARGTRMVVTKVEEHSTSYGGKRWRFFMDVILP